MLKKRGTIMTTKRKDKVKFIRTLTSVFFFFIIILTISQVFFRFVLGSPLIWSEELARFLLIWMTMLGSAVLSYDDSHLAVTAFIERLSPKARLIFDVLNKLIIVFMLIFSSFYSYKLIKASYFTSSGALNISFAIWRAAAPVGCILMAIYTIYRLVQNIQLYKKNRN